MANTTWSREWTDFATATQHKIGQQKFEDNVSRASKVLAWFMDDGGITGRANGKRYIAGDSGDEIEEPLMTELNTTGKWYEGTEEVDITSQNVGTAAFFQSKQLVISSTISGKEKRKNKGKEKVINLMKSKTDQAMISMRTLLAQALFSDGTGSNGKEIYGIQAIAPNDRGVGTAYGRIAANTSWWLSQRSRSGTTYGDVGDFGLNGRDYLKRLYNDCTEGNSSPDISIVSQELWEAYDSSLLANERFTSKKMRDLGYEGELMFMQTPVVWDRFHPDHNSTGTHRWYMLNSEFLALRYCPEANFSVLGFQRALKGDYVASPIIWQGALCVNARRMHGVGTGITGV